MTIKSICIVGLDDYAMLTGNSQYGFFGGESVQHVLLARAWRDLGLDVSFIVHDLDQPHVTTVDGMRAVTAFRPREGIRMLRFFHPRVSSVLRAMREVDADVYYQSPAGAWSGIAVGYAQWMRRRSVVRIASDLDCIKAQEWIGHLRDRKLFDYGLRRASLLAAQTEQQRRLLLQHYGVDSKVLNIAVEVPDHDEPVQKDIDVLWVGNLRYVKRADLLVEIARKLPQYRFALVGARMRGHESHHDDLVRAAAQLPNLTLAGSVPYEQTGQWFKRARLHVNTSDAEGFPNTFLQAWVRAVPVVSFFDPDAIIHRLDLGRACRDVGQMTAAIDELLKDPEQCERIGRRAREYLEREFSARQIAARYIELLGAELPASSSSDHATRLPARG